MRVSVMTASLKRELDILAKAAAKRSTVPILEYVHIATDDGGLVLTATDLHKVVVCRIPAKIVEDGAATARLVELRRVVALLDKAGKVDIDTEKPYDLRLFDDGTDTTAHVEGLDPEEYPVQPEGEWAAHFTIEPAALVSGLRQTLPFAATDNARPILVAVQASIDPYGLRLTAADNYYVGTIEQPCRLQASDHVEAIWSTDGLDIVAALAASATDVVDVDVRPNATRFRFFERSVTIRNVDGQYPNWQQVVRPDTSEAVTVSRTALAGALKLAHSDAAYVVLAAEDDHLTVAHLDPYKDVKVVMSRRLPAETRGLAWRIGMRPDLFTRAIAAVEGDTLRLDVIGPQAPMMLRTDGLTIAAMPSLHKSLDGIQL